MISALLTVGLNLIDNSVVLSPYDAAYAQAPNPARPAAPFAERDAFANACGVDHRISFRLGARSLFIAPRWLDSRSAIDLSNRFRSTCPNEPIDISDLYLNELILGEAGTPEGLGRPFFFFNIGAWHGDVHNVTTVSRYKMIPIPKVSRPHIEDITQNVFGAAAPPSSRVYRLVFPPRAGESQMVMEISCGGIAGKPGGRTCFTPIYYPYAEAFAVKYEFRQDRVPLVESQQFDENDMTREPGAVLAFDVAIRAWIDRLQVKPQHGFTHGANDPIYARLRV